MLGRGNTFTDQLPTLRAVTEVHTVLTSKCSTVHHADPQSPTNDKMLKHTLTVSADVYKCPIILLSAVYSGVYCNIWVLYVMSLQYASTATFLLWHSPHPAATYQTHRALRRPLSSALLHLTGIAVGRHDTHRPPRGNTKTRSDSPPAFRLPHRMTTRSPPRPEHQDTRAGHPTVPVSGRITIHTEQSPSWEASSTLASQDIPYRTWNPNVRYSVHNSPTLGPNWNQNTPVHAVPFYCKIHFNIIVLSKHRTSKWSCSLRLPKQNPVCIYRLPYTCRMPYPSHSSWLDHPNNTWWTVEHDLSQLATFFTPLSLPPS